MVVSQIRFMMLKENLLHVLLPHVPVHLPIAKEFGLMVRVLPIYRLLKVLLWTVVFVESISWTRSSTTTPTLMCAGLMRAIICANPMLDFTLFLML